MIATCHSHHIRVWDTMNLSQQQLGTFRAELKVQAFIEEFCGNGGKIACTVSVARNTVTYYDVLVWNIDTTELIAKLVPMEGNDRIKGYLFIQLSMSGDRIVIRNTVNVHVFDTRDGDQLFSFSSEEWIQCVAFCHQDCLVVSDKHGLITICDATSGELQSKSRQSTTQFH